MATLSSAQKLLLGFITLIIGIVIIGTIASQTNSVSLKSNIENESKTPVGCYAPTLITVTNESQLTTGIAWANASGYLLSKVNSSSTEITITAVWGSAGQSNGSGIVGAGTLGTGHGGYNQSIAVANYTLISPGYNLTNGTLIYAFPNVSVSYTLYTSDYLKVNISNTACNLTVANPPTGWKTTDCPLTSVSVRNGTGSTATSGTDYNLFDSSGVIQLLDTSRWSNDSSNVSYFEYTYCSDNYVNSTFGRSSITMVGGFFAIALLLVSVGLFYSVAKDEGII